MSLALLIGLACATGPRSFEDCADLACREAWLEAHWDQGEPSLSPLLDQITEPMDQELLTVHLAESHPGDAAWLCLRLHPGPTRTRCLSIARRPHLWAQPPSADLATGRAGGGPRSAEMLPDLPVPAWVSEAPPKPTSCPGTADSHGCQSDRAKMKARRQRPTEAVSLCQAITEQKWREECLFVAAEELLKGGGTPVYGQAADMCLGTGEFASNCLAHLVLWLGSRPVNRPGRRGTWEATIPTAEHIAEHWETTDPSYGRVAVSRFWSELVQRTYTDKTPLSGDLLDVLPAAALPHVRATIAARLLAAEAAPDRTLSAWVDALSAVLDRRGAVPLLPTHGTPYHEMIDAWPRDLDGEDRIPARIYMGTSRRAWSDDRRVDLAICVLEAAARQDPPWTALLEQARTDDAPLVAWTAKRLLERRDGQESSVPELERYEAQHP